MLSPEVFLVPLAPDALLLFSFYLQYLNKHVEKKSIRATKLKKN